MHDSLLKRILVVDDEVFYRTMIQQFLTRMNYSCEIAEGAAEALQMLSAAHFDLVVSDIRMKGLDGLQLMKAVKEEYPHVEFIIMTGYPDDYSYSDIIDAGAADFIAKPFDLGKLRAKIERIDRELSTLKKLKVANDAMQWEAGVNASMADLSKALLASTPIGDISRLVLEHARKLTQSPFGYICYIDRETGHSVSVCMSGDSCQAEGNPDQEKVPHELESLWAGVIENRQAFLTNNAPACPGSVPGLAQTRRLLSVPSLLGEDLTGQVAVADSDRDYTERDQELLERLATIYALAIQRKWGEDELRKAHDALEELLHERSAKLSKAGELLRKSMKSLESLRHDVSNE